MTTTTTLSELTGHYVLDTARTRIGFTGRHTMATRVPGQFGAFDGSAYLDGDDPSRSRVELTIQADSIQTGNTRRDDQLRRDFLDTGGHPALTFTSAAVRQIGPATFDVTGDLTIRGVSKQVTVTFELTGARHDRQGGFQVAFTGGLTINRNDWNVNWNAATKVMISPKVTLRLDVVAIRRP